MILVLSLIGFVIVTTVVAFYSLQAPMGYQDGDGFHFGCPGKPMLPPERENIFRVCFRISWARPALGLAAAIVCLLTIAPGNDQNQNQHSVPKEVSAVQHTDGNFREKTSLFGPSAQMFPNFCQKDTEAQ